MLVCYDNELACQWQLAATGLCDGISSEKYVSLFRVSRAMAYRELTALCEMLSDIEDALALRMGRLWTSFAKGEDISSEWPRWTPATRQTLVLNDTTTVESTLELCGVWDSLRDAYFW